MSLKSKVAVRALTAVTMLVALLGSSQAADKTITVQAWGTSWEQGLQKVADDFEKQTGIHVEPVTQSGSADGYTRLQSMANDPKIDVWFTTSSLAARVTSDTKLFASIPPLPENIASAMIPGAVTDRWVAAYYHPLSIIYRPSLTKGAITGWSDLWHARFKESLAVPDVETYQARMLLVSALTNGGSIDNIGPGFDALKRLRPNIAMFYGSDSDARRALAQGDVSVLVGPPSQAKPLRDAGVDVAVVSPKPSPVMFDVMTLVNTSRKDLAVQFINFVVSKNSQTTISYMYDMGPANSDAVPSPDLAAVLPARADQVSFNEAKINASVAAWNEKFKSDVAH